MWDRAQEDYQRIDSEETHHEGSFGHELLAGAGSFAAFKAFEDHQRSEGKPVSHAFAKELLAGFVGGEVDKLVETKGLDWIDAEKAKRHGREQAERMYDDHYGDMDQYDPNEREPPRHIQEQWN